MTLTEPSVSLLDDADLRKCQALADDRGWAREDIKYRLLFDIGEPYGIRASDDSDVSSELAACAVLTNFGSGPAGVAAVSMVLVASRFGRQGLGTRLMRHVLAQTGARTVILYASPLGVPLYASLGFRTADRIVVHRGTVSGVPGTGTRVAVPADHAAIRELDAQAWRTDRSTLLDWLLTTGQVRVAERGGAVAGYAAARRYETGTVVGPVIARDEDLATALTLDTARAAGGPMRIDVEERAESLRAAVRALGLETRSPAPTPFMIHGDRLIPGDPFLRYAPSMQALG